MKISPILAVLLVAALSPISAQDFNINRQSAEELLQRGLQEFNKFKDDSSKKKKDKKEDDDELWDRSKEHQKMSRDDFAKKAQKGMKNMQVAIAELEQSGSSLTGRTYFQLRIQSLKEQLNFSAEELVKLSSEVDEASYLAKLKNFDRLLKSLSDHIALSQEDAGLR